MAREKHETIRSSRLFLFLWDRAPILSLSSIALTVCSKMAVVDMEYEFEDYTTRKLSIFSMELTMQMRK